MAKKKKAAKKAKKDVGAMDPATAVFTPGRHSGSTSEKFYQAKKDVSTLMCVTIESKS